MPGPARVVLVGGGLAAAKTAQSLRKRGYDGELTLLTAEPHLPYERPPLSKGYLMGTDSPRPSSCIARTGTPSSASTCASAPAVTGIDPTGHEVGTADGDASGYNRLLLATGSSPRRLDARRATWAGVLPAPIDDSERIKGAFRRAARS